jgi:uncharacterized protein (TIGR02466 family)
MEYSDMVDVKEHLVFPTAINEFKYDMPREERDYIFYLLDLSNNWQTSDNLHTKTELNKFTDHIQKTCEHVLTYQGYEYDSVEITNMWANGLKKGETHAPHTHSNNILSGVYYLVASPETAPIQFFDPRPQASVMRPKINVMSKLNSSMIQFESIKNVGFVFPSWLQHWVPPTNIGRLSISWNVIIRGQYGEPHTLQNSHI